MAPKRTRRYLFWQVAGAPKGAKATPAEDVMSVESRVRKYYRAPGLNLSVNKRDPSTRENGEFYACERVFASRHHPANRKSSRDWRDDKSASTGKYLG
jgi:hypothetical protein